MISFAAIVPHPPESIPGIGRADDFKAIKKTLEAFKKLRIGLEKADPDTIVVISPHAHIEPYYFSVNFEKRLTGSFEEFGLNKTLEFQNDIKIIDEILFACSLNVNDMPVYTYYSFLDHGTMIPLYHLTKNIKPKIIHLSFSLMNYDFHYRYGEILKKVFEKSSSRIAIIASADLSHRLSPNAPAGYYPRAQEFDQKILRYLKEKDILNIMNLDRHFVSESAECGLRSIIILLGVLHGVSYKFNLLSYENPFGVGYLVARMI